MPIFTALGFPPRRARRGPSLRLATLSSAAFAALLSGQDRPATTTPGDPGTTLQALLDAPVLQNARVGVLVHDLETGAELAAHDPDHGFMTASNMKLVASSTALCTLGPEFRFTTSLLATGPIHDGVLHGDLVLVGDGDPTFGTPSDAEDGAPLAVLRAMAAELRSRHGLTRITGDVLGDDNCHPDEVMGEGWAWGYQADSYAAQISGLCFAENCVSVVVEPAAPGRSPTARLVPATSYLTVEVRAETTAPGTPRRLWLHRERGSHRIVVGGVIPADAESWRGRVTVENPCAYAATALLETLEADGVAVDGAALDRDLRPERPDRYGDATVLARHRSAPLGEILVRLNKISQNLYAEQLIRAAARRASGSGGMRAATAHAKAVLQELGGDPRGMRIADGSGLSRLNLVTPRQLVALLGGMHGHPHGALFSDTLPIAGVDGTLRNRMQDTVAQSVVRAKTGYISSVVALSGYVPRADPDRAPLVFSILVNNFTTPTREVQGAVDSFVVELARHAGHDG